VSQIETTAPVDYGGRRRASALIPLPTKSRRRGSSASCQAGLITNIVAHRCTAMSQSNMSSIRQLPDGRVVEVPPERCPAGHPLLPRGTLVGWSPCDCTPGVHGHRTYTCRFLVDWVELWPGAQLPAVP
jgi:hypothetical protein